MGVSALGAGRWDDARAAFEAALAEEETPKALDGLGEALWWLGEPRASIEYRERAYVAFRRTDDKVNAAWAAIALCVTYAANFGNGAAAGGWFARAERVIGDADPGPLRGWLWLMRGWLTAEHEPARELIERALDLGRETGDIDLELAALADLGDRLVAAGKVEEGLGMIDEAMTGTLAGECRRFDTVAWASCQMLGACEVAGDLERAMQWLRVIDDFTDRYGCPFVYATCRAHYGSLLVEKGHWDQAEQELSAALRMAGRAGPVPHAQALAQLAELRLRQGRLEEAEALLSGFDHEQTATLATARVRLARGEPAVAVALLERRLDQVGLFADEAATLAMLVEAHIAASDPEGAAVAAARLKTLAATHGRGYVTALASDATGQVAMARGRPDEAVAELERALDLFSRLDLPLQAARVRLNVARARAAEGRLEIAVAEARSGLKVFDNLGAAIDGDAAAELLRSLGATGRIGPRGTGVLSRREREVLQLVGLGLSNPEIAQRLFISRKTVAHHVSSVLAKLGLRNRAEAVAHAARQRS